MQVALIKTGYYSKEKWELLIDLWCLSTTKTTGQYNYFPLPTLHLINKINVFYSPCHCCVMYDNLPLPSKLLRDTVEYCSDLSYLCHTAAPLCCLSDWIVKDIWQFKFNCLCDIYCWGLTVSTTRKHVMLHPICASTSLLGWLEHTDNS